jgi:regulator of protease activity HflC (stomatin/prohibitin superfamily)
VTVVGQLFAFIDQVPSPWNQVIKFLLALGGIIYLLFKTFKYVPEGHKALRLRFQTVVFRGDTPVVLEKGLHIMVPFVHSLQIVSVLDRTINLEPIALRTETYIVDDIRATVVLHVRDIYKLTYVVDDFVLRMTAACEHALRLSLLGGLRDGLLDVQTATTSFKGAITATTDELGVEFAALNITNIAPNAMVMVAGAISGLGQPATSILGQLGVPSINGSAGRSDSLES